MSRTGLWLAFSMLVSDAGIAALVDEPLENTHWRLVQIQSMDDSVIDPDPDLAVGLYLGPEGLMRTSAGCAAVQGGWSLVPPSGLTFDVQSPAAGAAMPAGAAMAFANQLPWVRSAVMQDGKLFLATMADGSIIELAPADADPVGAVVLGESVSAGGAEQLQELVLTRIFAQYAAEQGLEASEDEIAALVAGFVLAMESDTTFEHESENDLSEEERAQLAAMRRALAGSIITRWKVGRSLYREYGGRIIYQQLGPEPLDAYRQYLEAQQQAGKFSLCDDGAAEYFWGYFTDEQRHSFMAPGSEDEAQAFEAPPWAAQDSRN